LLPCSGGGQIDSRETRDSHCRIAKKECIKKADMKAAIACIKYTGEDEWDEREIKEMDMKEGTFFQYESLESVNARNNRTFSVRALRHSNLTLRAKNNLSCAQIV
jgi:hypothetical protein